MAAKSCRGLPAELAAKLVVKVTSSAYSSFLRVYHDAYFALLLILVSFCSLGGIEIKGPEGRYNMPCC